MRPRKTKRIAARFRLERIEAIYLHALRVAGLLAATACLAIALFFGADALWRFAVPTNVKPEPTAVDSAVLARMVSTPDTSARQAPTSNPLKTTHDAFTRNFWPKYYAIYQGAAGQYQNTQAPIASPEVLMRNLGYDYNAFERAVENGGPAPVLRLVNDANYQQAALKHVGEVFASTSVKNRLASFTRANKSEQRCTTTPVTQRVNQVCGYYYVYDCSYTRTIDQRRCENVFPAGVLSPAAAFEKADTLFSAQWLADEGQKLGAANAKAAGRQALRDGIGPRIHLALMILGGFLVVMFFFLLIAIERHLRPAKKENDPIAPPTIVP